MPRPNTGPRLDLRQPKRYAAAVYFIVWYESGRERIRSTGTSSLQDAQRALEAHLAANRTAISGHKDPEAALVTDALAAYATERAARTQRPERIGYAIKALVPFWTGKKISEVTERTCATYVASRQVSGATARRELGVLAAALNYCVRAGHLKWAPPVSLPPKSEPRTEWLSRSQAASLIRAARKQRHLAAFIMLGLYTGTRPEALLKLQWERNPAAGHIDLDAGTLYRAAQGRRENKKRQPPVRLPNRLLAFLKRHRRHTARHVIEYKGQPVKQIKHAFATAAHAAGVPDATPYALRHTSITWRMLAGVPTWQNARFHGTSEEMIERVYGHHSPEHLERARSAF